MKRLFPFSVVSLSLLCSLTQAQSLEAKNQAVDFNNRALALSEQGRDEDAVKLYDRAIQIDKGNRTFFFNRGRSLQTLGRFKEALEDANRAIELDAFTALHFDLRASLWDELKQWDKSKADFERALALDPDQPAIFCNLGHMEWRSGQWSAALRDVHRALAMQGARVAPGDESLGTIRSVLAAARVILGWPLSAQELELFSEFPQFQTQRMRLHNVLMPRADELRFEARCVIFDAKTGVLTFDALAFELPNGRGRSLPAAKCKTARLGRLQLENMVYGPLEPNLLRPDDALVIVGHDNGEQVTPRVVCVGTRSQAESQARGFFRPKIGAPDQAREINTTPPDLAGKAVGQSTFISSNNRAATGRAFVVDGEQGKKLLTTWNSTGPTPATLGKGNTFWNQLVSAQLMPFDRSPVLTLKLRGSVNAAEIKAEEEALVELLIVDAPETGGALKLAKKPLRKGDLVWLPLQTTGKPARLVPLVVGIGGTKTLIFSRPDGITAGEMRGAPLLNHDGDLIGIVIGEADSIVFAASLETLQNRALGLTR